MNIGDTFGWSVAEIQSILIRMQTDLCIHETLVNSACVSLLIVSAFAFYLLLFAVQWAECAAEYCMDNDDEKIHIFGLDNNDSEWLRTPKRWYRCTEGLKIKWWRVLICRTIPLNFIVHALQNMLRNKKNAIRNHHSIPSHFKCRNRFYSLLLLTPRASFE